MCNVLFILMKQFASVYWGRNGVIERAHGSMLVTFAW